MMNSCVKHGRDDFYSYLIKCINADLVQNVLAH